jgi:hypothetical protein
MKEYNIDKMITKQTNFIQHRFATHSDKIESQTLMLLDTMFELIGLQNVKINELALIIKEQSNDKD